MTIIQTIINFFKKPKELYYNNIKISALRDGELVDVILDLNASEELTKAAIEELEKRKSHKSLNN